MAEYNAQELAQLLTGLRDVEVSGKIEVTILPLGEIQWMRSARVAQEELRNTHTCKVDVYLPPNSGDLTWGRRMSVVYEDNGVQTAAAFVFKGENIPVWFILETILEHEKDFVVLGPRDLWIPSEGKFLVHYPQPEEEGNG